MHIELAFSLKSLYNKARAKYIEQTITIQNALPIYCHTFILTCEKVKIFRKEKNLRAWEGFELFNDILPERGNLVFRFGEDEELDQIPSAHIGGGLFWLVAVHMDINPVEFPS